MGKQAQRTKQTWSLLDNKDLNPGFRKLLDCVADTQQLPLFKEAIALTDWTQHHPEAIEESVLRAKDLLAKTENISLTEADTTRPVVTAQGIYKKYRTGGFSLGPVSLEIRKGQVYGLVGENGNGKTTLLRLLARELHYDHGDIQYSFSQSVKDDFGLRTRLVYIPQRTKKWYGSLRDNLKLVPASYGVPAAENEIRVLFMIARLGLWKYRDLKWSELSSGYKMRFELARTLLRKPELLLLDEPLANLDVLAQQIILEDLKSIAGAVAHPIALMLSSQQLYEVEKISDKVIYLKNGKYTDKDFNVPLPEKENLVVELETRSNRETLAATLAPVAPQKISYNGGVYVVYFQEGITFEAVMAALGRGEAKVTYVRDITHSTRKYFVG